MGEWRVNSGQWTVDSGQWTVDSGQWTVDSGFSECIHLFNILQILDDYHSSAFTHLRLFASPHSRVSVT